MRKKKRYVVGYDTDGDCVYGKSEKPQNSSPQWCMPMTIFDAKRELKWLSCAGTLPQDLLDINPSVLNKLVNAGMALPGVKVNIEKIVATRGLG